MIYQTSKHLKSYEFYCLNPRRAKKNSSLKYEFLLTDEIVCIADKEHPVSENKTITLEEYQKYPHFCVRYPKSGWILSAEELINRPAVESISIHNSSENISLLRGAKDCLVLGSRRLAEKYSSFYGYSVIKPEFNTPKVTISLCTHINRDNDRAVLWIISLIKEIAAKISLKK